MIVLIRKKNGFTLVELLATLVILGIVMTITIITVSNSYGDAKTKTENVFIKTIEDALSIYLDSNAKELNYSTAVGDIRKSHGTVKLYKAGNLTFQNVISSNYSPITASDLVNPANEKVCTVGALVEIYKDEDYVYYYAVKKSNLGCLNNTSGEDGSYITNLPCEYLYNKYGQDSLSCNCIDELVKKSVIAKKPDRCKK